MNRRMSAFLVLVLASVQSCQQRSLPAATDTHGLVEEVHHKPDIARKSSQRSLPSHMVQRSSPMS